MNQYYNEDIPAIQAWLNYSLGLGADGKPAGGNILLPPISGQMRTRLEAFIEMLDTDASQMVS